MNPRVHFVVTDTSPINYLYLIGHIELLPTLFSRVHAPRSVYVELQRAETPPAVREGLSVLPPWLELHAVPSRAEPALAHLDEGERDAILLAEGLNALLLLVDEKAARLIAEQRGVRVAGVLGILEEAAHRGLCDIHDALWRLERTNFRVSPRMLRAIRARHSR